jgi:hypothetical protein
MLPQHQPQPPDNGTQDEPPITHQPIGNSEEVNRTMGISRQGRSTQFRPWRHHPYATGDRDRAAEVLVAACTLALD